MKFKTTKKAINQGYYRILGTGYCSLQHLLNFEEPRAYSTRAEGWACDYYEVDSVCISTGYAPITSKNVKKDYEMIQRYEEQARAIAHGEMDIDHKREAITALLHQFIKEVTAL